MTQLSSERRKSSQKGSISTLDSDDSLYEEDCSLKSDGLEIILHRNLILLNYSENEDAHMIKERES